MRWTVIASWSLLIVGSAIWHSAVAQKGEYRGCFADNENLRDLPYKSNAAGTHLSADRCVDECTHQHYMYSGLQDGKSCFCGSSFGKYGVSNCTVHCESNRTQLCGGINANSIYNTGVMVPGPPSNVSLIAAKENSLVVRWSPPIAPNGIIQQYKVSASLIFTYIDMTAPPNPYLTWTFSNTTFEAELPGLAAATHYNISVLASSASGDGRPLSVLMWTDVAEPDHPPMAEIIRKEGTQMTIEIPDVQPTKGPISAYRVVVYDDTQNFPLDPKRLTNYYDAKQHQLPFYVAAELLPAQARTQFIVGDNGTYGGYYNAPLRDDNVHTVVIGVISRLNGVTKEAYSTPSTHHVKFGGDGNEDVKDDSDLMQPAVVESSNPFVYEDRGGSLHDSHDAHDMYPEEREIVYEDSALVTGLGVAVGIGAALLVASIIVYFMLRRHYGRRQQPDHQELTLQSPSPEVVVVSRNSDGNACPSACDNDIGIVYFKNKTENGVTSSIMVLEDEGDLDILYDSLKDKFWQIPRLSLEISEETVGQGKYGGIYKGITRRRNHEVSVSVQVTQAHITDNEREKRAFLNDLDALIRIGSHTNVVGLVGGCEERVLFHVCTEWYPDTLKNFLLDSRTMDHYPVYAERQNRMSTLKEMQLLEIALGVARGMAHLAHNKIVHKRLTSRSVVIVDEVTAKITDFGLLQTEYEPSYDVTRWMSMESLKNRLFTSKSDVWMFGVVVWEIITLGATPYASVKTKDVPGRILRGSRLHQPKNVGDDLYQIMLQCWQVDLDERPTFQVLTSILGTMVTEGSDIERLHLDIYPGFQYEKYDKELETVSAVQ